ncbi:MAG: hypothetical protein M3367_18460 [Acidobacteriota bacterium]|nr:hypothetical protein [Acidobacteriota bacterium]
MSGGITFSPEKVWIVATWAYRYTTDFIRNHVSEDSFPKLYSLVTEDENPLNFIFLDKLTVDERREFFSAVKLAYDDIIKENGKTFVSREYYENYLILLKELMEMIPDND